MSTQTHKTVPSAAATFITDLQAFLQQEDALRFVDLFTPCVVSGGTHGTAAGLTATPAALLAYPGGYYTTETGSITYQDASTTWVIAHSDTTGNQGSFTRVSGTHYLIDATGTQPSLPSGCLWLMKVTTSGGAVTAVTDLRNLSATGLNHCFYSVNYTSLDTALSAIGSSRGTLLVSDPLTVLTNQSVPTTLTIMFIANGSLSIPSGVTVTMTGPIIAPLQQIFSGSGTVSFSGNTRLPWVFPQWWGATGDGTTNDTAAIQSAITAWHTFFPPGTYVLRGEATLAMNGQRVTGTGATIYWDTPGNTSQGYLGINGAVGCEIWGLSFKSTNTGALFNSTYQQEKPIILYAANQTHIHHNHFQDYYGNAAVYLGTNKAGTATTSSDDNDIHDNVFLRGAVYGAVVVSGRRNRIHHNYAEDASLGSEPDSSSNLSDHNVVSDNVLRGVLRDGTSGGSSIYPVLIQHHPETATHAYNDVRHNHILNGTLVGTSAHGKVEGNTVVVANLQYAYHFPLTPNAASSPVSGTNVGLSITHNVFDCSALAYVLTDATGAVMFAAYDHSTFALNEVFGSQALPGVLVRTLTHSSVIGNHIHDNAYAGIEVYGDSSITDLLIMDNHILNNGTYGIHVRGIVASTTTRVTVRSNKVQSTDGTSQPKSVSATDTTSWVMEGNDLSNYGSGGTAYEDGGSNTGARIRDNVGWVTEASGTASILSGTTSVVVTHGLSATPSAKNIVLTRTATSTNLVSALWIDTITSTQFTINCNTDPGASNLAVSWQAMIL